MKDERLRELAEAAMSYLFDNDLLEDFLDDRFIELTDEECDYFGFSEVDNVYD